MGRLIDVDALPEHKFPEVQCNGFSNGSAYRQGWNDAIDAIMNYEDTVDAVPVRHGQWETDGMMMDECEFLMTRCTACGGTYEYGFNMPFCPNCGARMDGEDGEHETD